MPYIKKEAKEFLDKGMQPRDPGELNYVFTCIIQSYWSKYGRYQTINDIVGALEGAKLEFYRRVAAPYENTKIEENGDVY